MNLGLADAVGAIPDGYAGSLFLGWGWFAFAEGLAGLDA